ncbi:hypothetical protein TNCV_4501381 [Trichonephila clavipes]|nr:hypothetical protein TNCV_4501381 [Trichonephila clavipes]
MRRLQLSFLRDRTFILRTSVLPTQPVGSGGLEVACPLHKPKVACSTLAVIDRFSGCENRRHACHMITWHEAKRSLKDTCLESEEVGERLEFMVSSRRRDSFSSADSNLGTTLTVTLRMLNSLCVSALALKISCTEALPVHFS